MKKLFLLLIFILLLGCEAKSNSPQDTKPKKVRKTMYHTYYIEALETDKTTRADVWNIKILCIDGYKYLFRYEASITQMREYDEEGNEVLARCPCEEFEYKEQK